MLKNRGPRIDPCGTAAIILSHSLNESSIFQSYELRCQMPYLTVFSNFLSFLVVRLVYCGFFQRQRENLKIIFL